MKEVSIKSPVLGGDPEFFVVDKESKKVISSDVFFPSKDDKMYVPSAGSLHFDGVQAEINFTPSKCREIIQDNMWKCLKAAKYKIGEANITSAIPSVVMSLRDLKNADPEARRFGCNPDWNAYTRAENVCTIDGETHRTRYGGGHIHIEIDKNEDLRKNRKMHLEFIKLLDVIVGIPTTMLDQSYEAKRRRKCYGHAGCFRPTCYGIEYRTPSNFWLLSPALTNLILGLARLAYSIQTSGLASEYLSRVTEDEVQDAINKNSFSKSLKIYNKVRDMFLFHGNSNRTKINSLYTLEKEDTVFAVGKPYLFEFAVNYGVRNIFGGYENIENNWKLNLSVSHMITGGETATDWHLTMKYKAHEDTDIENAILAYKDKFRMEGNFQQMSF